MPMSKEKQKAWRESHKAYFKEWRQKHKEYHKEHMKAWRESHQEEYRAYYRSYNKAYQKDDVNTSGQTKHSIRCKSNQYLSKHGIKKPGYEIHHCFTYDDPTKFIYCSIETHQLIHAYLREHNIDADTDHYEQIKHLLDDTVVLYGINEDTDEAEKS